jgi:hypothetical protein
LAQKSTAPAAQPRMHAPKVRGTWVSFHLNLIRTEAETHRNAGESQSPIRF